MIRAFIALVASALSFGCVHFKSPCCNECPTRLDSIASYIECDPEGSSAVVWEPPESEQCVLLRVETPCWNKGAKVDVLLRPQGKQHPDIPIPPSGKLEHVFRLPRLSQLRVFLGKSNTPGFANLSVTPCSSR